MDGNCRLKASRDSWTKRDLHARDGRAIDAAWISSPNPRLGSWPWICRSPRMMSKDSLPPHSVYKLYGELAPWWPLLSRPEDYSDDAKCVWRILRDASEKSPATILELGSGGGNTASHLKKRAKLTLVDQSEGMLQVSRELNPECEHVVGDMRTVRLGREFDAVYIHDSIMYMTRVDELRAAIETAVAHCRPGGRAAFLPDCTRETFRETSHDGGHDRDGRSLRYLQWDIDHDPTDTEYTVHFAYLLRDSDGTVRTEFEKHRLGIFPRATWLRLIEKAGCQVYTSRGPGKNEVFVGVKAS